MHKHRSDRALFELKLKSLHFIFNISAFLTASALLAYAAIDHHQIALYSGLGIGIVWILSSLLFVIGAHKLQCPLCMIPLFAHKQCSKNKAAKRVMGSYRLGVSFSILGKGHYRCIYCGEPFDAKTSRTSVTSHG